MPSALSIEQRLQRLENIEEIRCLKHAYCRACDANYDADAIAALFCEDAVWDGGAIGMCEGREAIRAFFARSHAVVPFALHFVSNAVIAIDGDEAEGVWDLWQPMVFNEPDGPHAYWFVARYDDRFRRTSAGWRISKIKATTRMLSPYEAGFAQVRMVAEYPGNKGGGVG